MTANLSGPILDRGAVEGLREWFDGFPLSLLDPDYLVLFDDFVMVDDDQTNDWTVLKDTGASVGIQADTLNGVLLFSSAATTDNDGSSIQGNEIILPAAGRTIWFEARLKISDADQMDAFLGLSENFATNPEAVLTASNRIGFQIADGDASILCKSEKVDTETSKDSEEDAADDTYVKVGFRVEGLSRIKFYINRIEVAEITTNIPIVELTPAAFELSGDASGTKTMSLDYILVAQTR